MKEYAIINKKRIAKFDIDYYLKKKNYQMASALKALDVTNDIQISFFKEEENLEKEGIFHYLSLFSPSCSSKMSMRASPS